MENKFEEELIKIEKLLNKIDSDLTSENIKKDFSTFFKNIDKTFEIYNICLEELCGQLYLLELSNHSKVFRKLYHHYKHQLYNIMKYQLTLQKDLNDKIEEDKNSKSRIDSLKNKVKVLKDKKVKLHSIIDDQKIKIEKLIISNNQNNDKKKFRKSNMIKKTTEIEIDFQIDNDNEKVVEEKWEEGKEKEEEQNVLAEVDKILNDDSTNIDPKIKVNLKKLLEDLEIQRKKYDEMQSNNQNVNFEYDNTYSLNKKNKINIQTNTSTIFYSEKQYNNLQNEFNLLKENNVIMKMEFESKNSENVSKISELEKIIKDFQEELKSSKEGSKYLESLNKEIREELENYEKTDENIKKELTDLKNEIKKKDHNIINLNLKVNNLEELNGAIHEEIMDREEREEIVEKKEENLKNLVEEKNELKKKLIKMETRELNREIEIEEDMKILLVNKNNKIESYEKELNKMIKNKKETEIRLNDFMIVIEDTENNFNDLSEKYKKIVKKNYYLEGIIKKFNKGKKFKLKKKNKNEKQKKRNFKKESGEIKSIQNMNSIKEENSENNSSQKNSNNELQTSGFELSSQGHINIKSNIDVHRDSIDPKNLDIEKIKNFKKKDSQKKNKINSDSEYENSENEDSYINSYNTENESFQNIKSNEILELNDKLLKKKNYVDTKNKENQIKKGNRVSSIINNEKKQLGRKSINLVVNKNDVNSNDVVINCHRGIQCKYSSPVNFILENQDEVFCKETDFEKIKDCMDFLARVIGFENVEAMFGENRRYQDDGNDLKKNYLNNNKVEEKLIPKFQTKINFKKSIKLNLERTKNIDDTPENSKKKKIKKKEKFDMEKFKESLKKGKKKYNLPDSKNKRKGSKSPKLENRTNYLELSEEGNMMPDWEDDYIVKKKKIITTEHRTEKIEVVEYIRIPKELTVTKAKLNPIERKYLSRIRTLERKLLNEFELKQRNKEKLYFNMYLNIKNRYKYNPQKLIKIYNIYFNRVPEFKKKLNDNYNPEEFLFNFEEFKTDFKEIINMHQKCGRNCLHLRRFYEKSSFTKTRSRILPMSNTIINKLPGLLVGQDI